MIPVGCSYLYSTSKLGSNQSAFDPSSISIGRGHIPNAILKNQKRHSKVETDLSNDIFAV